MDRHLRFAILLTAVLLVAGPAPARAQGAKPQSAPVPAPASAQSVTVEQGVVSIDVRDMKLDDVLRALAEQSGINITVHSGGAAKVTQSFTGVGVDEGIRRLAPTYNVVLVYGSGAEDKPGASHLVEVHVYETSSKSPVTAVVDPRQRSTQLQAVRDLSRKARRKEPGALTSLTDVLARDPDPAVRRSAAEALAGLPGPEVVPALRAGTSDQDPSVRGRSVVSLGQMRDEESVGLVTQLATRDPDPSVRRSAVWALSTLRSEEARRGLEAAAGDQDELVQSAAMGALKQWALRGKQN